MRHRYIVTSAYRAIGSDKLEYLGSHTNRLDANFMASRVHSRGGRALVHDRTTGLIIRDTGKPSGQVWANPSRKGQKSPAWEEA
ncbi:MAG: hypothetical protein ACHQX3_00090 [Nitrospirales bacterium]|jgi:hypothetical protein